MRRLATQMVRWVAQRRAGSEQDRGLDHFVRAAVAIGRNGWDRTFAITPCGHRTLAFLIDRYLYTFDRVIHRRICTMDAVHFKA
jgi:hypothetical protein